MRERVALTLDGAPAEAFAGESVAAFLLRTSLQDGRVRPGYACGMGACFACLLEIDGRRAQACLTPVASGMRIATGKGPA